MFKGNNLLNMNVNITQIISSLSTPVVEKNTENVDPINNKIIKKDKKNFYIDLRELDMNG